ncbi:MAG: hypothetical protein FJZ96_08770 [Chloroflexi bacterium]|nr:hypothetical protein [Chloroflexota bacterium]
MSHPFEFVPAKIRKAVLLIFVLLSLLILCLFQFVLDPPLKTALAPLGIVSFEMAWSVDAVRAILGSWDWSAKVYAAFGLGFDFLFMLSYTFAIGLGTLMASSRMGRQFAGIGKWTGWGVVAAALLDVVENILLFTIMTVGNYPPYALFASLAATVKFLLIFIGLVYALLGLFIPGRKDHPAPKKKKKTNPVPPPPGPEPSL